MSVLGASEIARLELVRPCLPRAQHGDTGTSFGLSFCGYDIRLDQTIEFIPGLLGGPGTILVDGVVQPTDSFTLASTMEEFVMATDVVGVVHGKSTWARRGIAVQNTVIEPGWRGFLTLELTFHVPRAILLPAGAPIAQVLFHRVEGDTLGGYSGKYQDQERGPQEARWWASAS